MKNVKTLLILLSISTFIFASATRTDALGGAGFWADDYANIGAFPASVNNHNAAWTNGNDFTSVWNADGTTWGFSGGMGNDDVVNMMWGNGNMGVTFGLGMSPEVTGVVDSGNCGDDMNAACGDAVTAADAATSYSIGFGMPLAEMDFGFRYDDSGTIGINLRRAQEIWEWDHILVGIGLVPEDFADGATQAANTTFNIDCYTNRSYDGGTSGLFALGFHYGDKGAETDGGDDPDATMNLVWNFAVESAMTDWGTLRVGYVKAHDFGGGANTGGTVTMGLGLNYGSFSLDMNIGDSYDSLLNDPVKWAAGRNSVALSSDWTISYHW